MSDGSHLSARILAWADQQPAWKSDLLRRLCERDPLDASDVEAVGLMLLAEHGGLDLDETAPAPKRLRAEHLPQTDRGGAVRLERLQNVTGAGLLAEEQSLDFGEGLTIVYGRNGAGKSSYAKILKNACRARRPETVLANVYAEPGTPAVGTAHFAWRGVEDGHARSERREHSAPPSADLRSIAVFDEHCAASYASESRPVDEELVPASLHIFSSLAAALELVKTWLAERRQDEASRRPNLEYAEREALVAELERVQNPSGALEALFADERAKRRLDDLEHALRDAETEQTARGVGALHMQVSVELQQAQRDRALTKLAQRVRDLRAQLARDERAAQAFQATLSELDLGPGTGGPAWRRMWTAAESYHQHAHPEQPTAEAERCPLCRQALDDSARRRFEHFAGLAEQEAQRAVSSTKRELEAALAQLKRPRRPVSDLVRAKLRPDEIEQLDAWEKGVARYQEAVEQEQPLPELPDDPVGALAALQNDVKLHLDLVNEAQASRPKLMAERDRLRARAALQSRPDDVREYVASLEREKAVRAAIDGLDKRGVTAEQKRLAKDALTKGLRKAFDDEVTALGLDHLRVKLATTSREAATQAKLGLEGAKVKAGLHEVLSTGERRLLALAFFLAEVRVAEHPGSIVLDDPVSSLDLDRRKAIAKRLADAAKRRQVIVFTHDIGFRHLLLERARLERVKRATIVLHRVGAVVGLVTSDEVITLTGHQQIAKLESELRVLRGVEHDPVAYERGCRSFLTMLRGAWERAVEKSLLNDAVMRFSPEIRPSLMLDVRVSAKDVDDVATNMAFCSQSAALHDQPDGFLDELPPSDELEKAVDALAEFVERCRKERARREKKRNGARPTD